MARDRTDMRQPLLGSALLHGGLAIAVLVSWPWLNKPIHMSAPVPVTIVTTGPVSNVRPAEKAPEDAAAMTEAPAPDAPAELVAPPEPKPQPTPTPKPVPPPPAPRKAQTRPQPKKTPVLDFDALAASLRPSRAAGKPRSSAQKGPSRAETSVDARPAVGQASLLARAALSELAADLGRRWNPNCEVEGGSSVNIKVAFRLDSAGRINSGPDASGENSNDPVVKAASDRAKRAIRQAEPFEDLPAELYGERINVTFDARTACASG